MQAREVGQQLDLVGVELDAGAVENLFGRESLLLLDVGEDVGRRLREERGLCPAGDERPDERQELRDQFYEVQDVTSR